jgi:hypothetical protein
MRKNNLWILMVSCIVLGVVCIFIYPNLKGEAQITQKEKQNEALGVVKSQPISNIFYEALKAEENSNTNTWNLTKGFFNDQSSGDIRTGDFEEWYLLGFQDNKHKVEISIFRYCSTELASKTISSPKISQGSLVNNKEFGDEGSKSFDDNGKLVGITFRKNTFVIYISCDSDNTAKQFAQYALKAVEGH